MAQQRVVFGIALAATVFAAATAQAGFIHDHTWSFYGADSGGDTLFMQGTLEDNASGNSYGGNEIINDASFTGSVSFNGGAPLAIDSILVNPYVVAANPYIAGRGGFDNGSYSLSYVYESPVQPAGYALDGYGIVFTYGPSDYQIQVWGLHDPQIAASGGATTTDPAFNSQFAGLFLLDPASLSPPPPSPTPLPAALPLFAGGLGAMGLLGWRRKRKVLSA
jgi:hypothetical protein